MLDKYEGNPMLEVSETKWKLLSIASFEGHKDIVRLLLRREDVIATIDHPANDGMTALHLALVKLHVESG